MTAIHIVAILALLLLGVALYVLEQTLQVILRTLSHFEDVESNLNGIIQDYLDRVENKYSNQSDKK